MMSFITGQEQRARSGEGACLASDEEFTALLQVGFESGEVLGSDDQHGGKHDELEAGKIPERDIVKRDDIPLREVPR